MRLVKIIVIAGILVSGSFAADFIPYKDMATKLLKENQKNGLRATTEDVKAALKSKDTLVADVRTPVEWAAAHIKGSVRVGRQSPENAIANFVLDDNDKLIKDKLIVVCNTAHRASIQAMIFRKMGFTQVKVYPIDEWIDKCNPVVTKYTRQEYLGGKHHRFGEFFAQECYKKK